MSHKNEMYVTTEKVIRRVRDAGLQSPEMLTLMITDACNIQCRHCWLDCGMKSTSGPVPIQASVRIIEDFVRLGGTGITLTGGEALTHPDWYEILTFACGRPALKEVCLQTNAMLVSRKIAKELTSQSHVKLSIQISIDGASAENHDLVRGKGSFDRTMGGLQRLVDAGMGPRIRVAFTEMRHNFADISPLMTRLESYGIRKLVSGTLVMGGRALREKELALPLVEQYREIISRYLTDPAFKDLYDRIGKITAIEWYKGRSTGTDHECACIKTPFADASGQLYPCSMLPVPKYGVGGLHQRSLADVVLDGLPLWAELAAVGLTRRDKLEDCRKCFGWDHCGGGCTGRAYAANGVLMAKEDRCALRRAVYSC